MRMDHAIIIMISLFCSVYAIESYAKQNSVDSKNTVTTLLKYNGEVASVLVSVGPLDPTSVINNKLSISLTESGETLWWASNHEAANLALPSMKFNISAHPTLVDSNYDQLIDHIYVADTGGQLFRFDILYPKKNDIVISGGQLLSIRGSELEQQRGFYLSPDVAQVYANDSTYYAIAIGSGSPSVNEPAINNHFYVFNDYWVNSFSFPDAPVTVEQFYDVTDAKQLSNSQNDVQQEHKDDFHSNHWLFPFEKAESMSSSPTIVEYRILFTTLVTSFSEETSALLSSHRLYVLDLLSGTPQLAEHSSDASPYIELSAIEGDATPILSHEETNTMGVCIGENCFYGSAETLEGESEEACSNDINCVINDLQRTVYPLRRLHWMSGYESY